MPPPPKRKHVDSSSEEERKPVSSNRSRRSTASAKSMKEASSGEEEEEEEDSNSDDSDSNSEEEEEQQEEEEGKKKRGAAAGTPKKKAKAKKAAKRVRRESATTPSRREETDGTGVVKPKKPPSKMKLLEHAMKANKWWEAKPLPPGVKWQTLEHNGVLFPEPYAPHGVDLVYAGHAVKLNSAAEELATHFAQCIGTQQLEKESTAKTFTTNFFKEFQSVLPEDSIVKEFAKCDFSKIRARLDTERERKKNRSSEEKEASKLKEVNGKYKYSFALVDGQMMKVGNTAIEPPGLFRGRGEHPKAGLLKPRIMPEDVILNIGEGAPVPECPIPGHSWGGIVHNHSTTWLANWKDMNGNNKYVYLAASSHFKGMMDREKYEKARRLKQKIPEIRADYTANMKSTNESERQIATAMWIIDRLALRVGGEKDEDEADTVGTCSLRVEHITLIDPYMVTLDFLGKDSMRHFQTYEFGDEKYEGVGKLVFDNLKSFVKGKSNDEQILHLIDPTILNDHLKTIMDGLSAKVFRTYNASSTLEKELPLHMPLGTTLEYKEAAYNDANRKVAILCNHQKSVSKAQELGLEKKQAEIVEFETQIKELEDMHKKVKKNQNVKLKPEDVSEDDKKKFSHLFEKQPTEAQVESRIEAWKKKLDTLKHRTAEADKNKTVALSTSKINYMDPRISVAWAKRNEFSIEKIFSATQRDKFPWAMSESDAFRF